MPEPSVVCVFGEGGRCSDLCRGCHRLECLKERASLSPFGQCALKKHQKTDFTVRMGSNEQASLKKPLRYLGSPWTAFGLTDARQDRGVELGFTCGVLED